MRLPCIVLCCAGVWAATTAGCRSWRMQTCACGCTWRVGGCQATDSMPAECSACAVASCFTSAAWLSYDSVPLLPYPGPASQSQRRGRIVQISSPPNHTSGRRLASWGQLHATGAAWVRLGGWRACAVRSAGLSIHFCSNVLCTCTAWLPACPLLLLLLPLAVVHAIIGVSWYLGASPQQLVALYQRLYTDLYR